MSAGRLEILTKFKNLNLALILLFSVTLLTLLGLVVLASASQSFTSHSGVFSKQLVWLVLAVLAGLYMTYLDLDKMRKWVPAFGVVSLVLLVAVLVVGVRVNGAMRWLDFGVMRLQVSEIAKVGLIFFLADYLARNQRAIRTFVKGFAVPSGLIGLVCLLVILEPDFGTTFLCAAIGFGVLFLAGVRLSFLFPSIFMGMLVFSVAVLLNPVRLKRLTSFLDVEAHKMDGAYQLWQGILAFAAGGVEGVGLGSGRQQMSFLPEAHTDFIFPIIGEELGLVFTCATVILFMVIFVVSVVVMLKVDTLYRYCLVAGAALAICLQALINIGVVTGLLPTKGMSLPFISYGGSNLILMFVLVGILLNCLRDISKQKIPKALEI